MAKDKIIGAIVLILGILIGIIYTMGSLVDLIMEQFVGNATWDNIFMIFGQDWLNWRLFVVLPIWLIVILICIIAIWIGYSMLTTPAPVPLEELEEELAAEEEGSSED